MDAKLQVISGKASKDLIPLKLPATIGRGKDASLTIAHPLISRQHCRLYESKGLLMVQDMGSTNGTYLGGRRIREAPLPPETEFSIGPLTFRVQYQYAGKPGALPDPVYADQQGEAAPAETPEFEAVDEDIDFLLAEDSMIDPQKPAKPAAKSVDKSTAKAVEKPRKLLDTKSSADDLLETTTLPQKKQEEPKKAKETPVNNGSSKKPAPEAAKPAAPKAKASSSAQPPAETPSDEISDAEFEKFFDDV
jgi:hypothetical protein